MNAVFTWKQCSCRATRQDVVMSRDGAEDEALTSARWMYDWQLQELNQIDDSALREHVPADLTFQSTPSQAGHQHLVAAACVG
jgi:hypothetical protein